MIAGDEGLFALATRSGLNMPLAALVFMSNFLLPVVAVNFAAGAIAEEASWGSLLAGTWGSLLNPNPFNPASTQPWLTICPSTAIFLTVFALNQFGEGLREATDPRSDLFDKY